MDNTIDESSTPGRPAGDSFGRGTGSGMEARLARLEVSVAHMERESAERKSEDVRELRAEIQDIRQQLTAIEDQVDRLPGRGFLFFCVLLTLIAMTALTAFQDEVQRLPGEVRALAAMPR